MSCLFREGWVKSVILFYFAELYFAERRVHLAGATISLKNDQMHVRQLSCNAQLCLALSIDLLFAT